MALRAKDSATAMQHFEKSLAADPDFLEPYINLGMLYRQAGRLQDSRAAFEAFLARAPRQAKYRTSVPEVQKKLAEVIRSQQLARK
jgi:tetratricopeptide (TPR) repeat protein